MSSDENTYLKKNVEPENTTDSSPSSKLSLLIAYCNLTVCITASALLSLPFAFDKTGWLLGLLMLAIVGMVVDYTLLCLSEVCFRLDTFDYQLVSEMVFGKIGRYLQAGFQLSLSLSFMVSYQVLSADNLEALFGNEWLQQTLKSSTTVHIILVLALTAIILFPLASFTSLKILGSSSFLSLLSVLLLGVALLYFDVRRKQTNTIVTVGPEVFTGVSVFATGFVCHQIATPILASLPGNKEEKRRQFHIVIHLSVASAFLFFCVVGMLGYHICHDVSGAIDCPGNILKWKSMEGEELGDSAIGKVAVAMFMLTTLSAYLIEHFSCYHTIIRLIYEEYEPPSSLIGFLIKLTLIYGTTLPAVFIQNVGPLVAWAGDLLALPLGFLLPLALAIQSRKEGADPASTVTTTIRICLLVVTGIFMILQTLLAFVELTSWV